jgi:alkaline phosphatase D
LGTGQHLAIWDDHDYGPDNSDKGFALKTQSLGLFQRYWVNPNYGLPEAPGVFFKVSLGDLDLFLLDDRSYRDPDPAPATAEKTLLGPRQLQWLKEGVKASRATFKLIAAGSRMLSDRPASSGRGGEGWHNFPQERTAFLDWLKAEGVEGLFFLSGDVHYTYLSELERPGSYPLLELICSPLTSRVHPRPFPIRELPGTLVTQRNFCTLDISGPAEQRLLAVSAWDSAGTRLWRETFPAAALRNP